MASGSPITTPPLVGVPTIWEPLPPMADPLQPSTPLPTAPPPSTPHCPPTTTTRQPCGTTYKAVKPLPPPRASTSRKKVKTLVRLFCRRANQPPASQHREVIQRISTTFLYRHRHPNHHPTGGPNLTLS